jgi:hypothetical protein
MMNQVEPYSAYPSGSPPPPGAGYQPNPYGTPPTSAPPKRKGPLRVVLIVVGLVAVLGFGCCALVFGIASCSLNATAQQDYFEVAGEKVPTVKYVLGEQRTVTSVASETSGEASRQTVAYSVASGQNREMLRYATYLMEEEGFIAITDCDFDARSAEGYQFAREAAKSGFIVVVSIDYDSAGYELAINTTRGELTRSTPLAEAMGIPATVVKGNEARKA